jgi:hypothetical protein
VPPLLLWCDPDREWLELLCAVAASAGFELWADPDVSELLIRNRFHNTPRAPRVVWLLRGRDEITWFKAFELTVEAVWTKSLLQALREFDDKLGQVAAEGYATDALARLIAQEPVDSWCSLDGIKPRT